MPPVHTEGCWGPDLVCDLVHISTPSMETERINKNVEETQSNVRMLLQNLTQIASLENWGRFRELVMTKVRLLGWSLTWVQCRPDGLRALGNDYVSKLGFLI